MAEPPRLSVAIPLRDEQPVIPELLRRLGAVLDGLEGGPHEIVLVDDGSRDGSWSLLRAAAAADARIQALSLSRGFGHQAAMTAALEHTSGELVVMMDGDLQDPPEAIPQLLARQREGFDVVYARRVERKEGPLLRLAYFLFYRLAARLTSNRLPLDAGDFALVTRRVVQELGRLPERQRYLRGLRSWVGFSQVGVPVERAARALGKSKYGWFDLFALAGDGIFAFSSLPLRAASLLGCGTLVLSSLYGVYALYAKLVLDQSPRGFTTLVLAILFLAGVQLCFLGLIGEYLGRVYEEVKGRPTYILRERVGGKGEGGIGG